jgi:hypothetical protein
MFVCCECCVLSGRGLCDWLITRPEESYRMCRVVVCDQETSKTRRLMPATGLWKIQPQWVVTPRKQTTNMGSYNTITITKDLYLYIGAWWWLYDESKHVARVVRKYNKYRCVWLTITWYCYWRYNITGWLTLK